MFDTSNGVRSKPAFALGFVLPFLMLAFVARYIFVDRYISLDIRFVQTIAVLALICLTGAVIKKYL